MSDLRQVDRVMLETLALLCADLCPDEDCEENVFSCQLEEIRALLTEQPEQDEAGECSECGGTGDAPRQRGMSFTDCAACDGTGLAPEPVEQPLAFGDAKCPDRNGAGGNPADICDTCAGSGLVPTNVPPYEERAKARPAAPQPECDCGAGEGDKFHQAWCAKTPEARLREGYRYIALALTRASEMLAEAEEKRDAAEEKLARLEEVSRGYLDSVMTPVPVVGAALEKFQTYLDKLAAERPTPPATEDGQ